MLVLKVLHILSQVWHRSAMLSLGNIISLGYIRKLRHREPKELYTISKLVGASDRSHTQASCTLILASSIHTLLTTHFHIRCRNRSGSRDVDPVNGSKNEKNTSKMKTFREGGSVSTLDTSLSFVPTLCLSTLVLSQLMNQTTVIPALCTLLSPLTPMPFTLIDIHTFILLHSWPWITFLAWTSPRPWPPYF